MKQLFILCSLVLLCDIATIARAQPPAPLAIDAAAQGHTLTIVVIAAAPGTLRITLPPGWTGTPHEQTLGQGVKVLSYQLEPGAAVGQGEILVQAWADGAYSADRAWVWGATPEAARAIEVRARLAMVRR